MRIKKSRFVGLLSVAVAVTLAAYAERLAAQAVIGGDWRADVDHFASKVVEDGLTPGLSVGVAIGDWVAFARGFGTADMSTGRRVDGDTPFYIASSTKSLTALAVVLAATRGDIDLDAPFTHYVPDARFAAGIDPGSVTVRSLLSMTSGISGNGPITPMTAYTGQFDPKTVPRLLALHGSNGHAGSFVYANIGYNLLGMVLEARFHKSWKDGVHDEVVAPVGMDHTSAWWSRLDHERVAYPHGTTAEGTFARLPVDKRDANMHAAGGHFASARDLARYLAAQISGGLVEGKRVLPEEAVRATHKERVGQDATFGPFHRYGWAWGWDLGTYEGDTLVHRFGSFAGYRSHMSFMPAHRIGVVVLTNGDGPASPAADLVAAYIYDRLLAKPGLEARYSARLDSLKAHAAAYREHVAAELAKRRTRLEPLRHPLEGFAGVYRNPVLGRAEWRVVAGGLELHLGVVRSRAEVFDAAKDQLRVAIGGSGTVVTFEFPAEGDGARRFTLAGLRFERVP